MRESMLPAAQYPGVYIEEVPSVVHPIPGVATPVTTFVGWLLQGPVNQATLVRSWVDFQTQFGSGSHLGNPVKHGGQQVYIVRTYTPPPASGRNAGLAVLLRAAFANLPPHGKSH